MNDIGTDIERVLLRLAGESSSALEALSRFDFSSYFNLFSSKTAKENLEKQKPIIKVENSYK